MGKTVTSKKKRTCSVSPLLLANHPANPLPTRANNRTAIEASASKILPSINVPRANAPRLFCLEPASSVGCLKRLRSAIRPVISAPSDNPHNAQTSTEATVSSEAESSRDTIRKPMICDTRDNAPAKNAVPLVKKNRNPFSVLLMTVLISRFGCNRAFKSGCSRRILVFDPLYNDTTE